MRPDELERRLQERLDALPKAARAELLHVLMLPDFDRNGPDGRILGQTCGTYTCPVPPWQSPSLPTSPGWKP
jgi:hypothetical protein